MIESKPLLHLEDEKRRFQRGDDPSQSKIIRRALRLGPDQLEKETSDMGRRWNRVDFTLGTG